MKKTIEKFRIGQRVFVSIIEREAVIKSFTWNGQTWLYSFENEEISAGEDYLRKVEGSAGGLDLPPTVFNATPPARCLVKIMYLNENGEGFVETVRSFASEAEFLFYWQTPANFGLKPEQCPDYLILSPAEVAAFLLPLQEKIVANEKQKTIAKKIFEEGGALAKELVELVGFGYMFQDVSGIVYKTNLPEWKSQKIEHQEIQRTRYEGEAKGSLSMPEARAAGFIVEGEGAKPPKKEKHAEQTLSGEF